MPLAPCFLIVLLGSVDRGESGLGRRSPRPPNRHPRSPSATSIPRTATSATASGLVERPGCGSEARGGWRQAAVFVGTRSRDGVDLLADLGRRPPQPQHAVRATSDTPGPDESRGMTPDEFRRNGHELIDWIADYLDGVGDRPVQATVEPGDVRAALPEHPPTEPESFETVMADVERVIMPGVTNWQHPNWFAYFPANNSLPVDPRRTALGRTRRAGDELGHLAGVHRTRDADARLDAGVARSARSIPLDERDRRRRDPGFGERGDPRRDPVGAISGDVRCGQRSTATPRSSSRTPPRNRTRASRRDSGSPGSGPTASDRAARRRRSRCAPMRWPR